MGHQEAQWNSRSSISRDFSQLFYISGSIESAAQIALARCKPLSDPVKSFARAASVGFFIYLLGAASKLSDTRQDLPGIAVAVQIWAMPLLIIISLPLSMWLLLRTGKRIPVIYLRAFRSDRPARRLRSILKATLGSGFRLSGIRPPRKRLNLFIRLFTQVFTALRYVGSEHFELEAEDHNWMARLLASYAHAPFIFIDVRDVTPHVETEIQLSYLAVGPERCVFIIDSARGEAEWTRIIRSALDLQPNDQPAFSLLLYPGDQQVDPKVFVPIVRQMIDRLPAGRTKISPEAIAFAQKHVSDIGWSTPFLETDAASTLFSTLGFVILFFGLGQLNFFALASGILWLIRVDTYVLLSFVALIYISYLIAWSRAWRQSGIESRFRRPGERNPRWRFALSLILMLVHLTLFGIAAGFFVLPSASARKIDKSIAVLPFENLSDDKENAYFAGGVQDGILTNLSKIGDLKVISCASVMSYRGQTRNVREIGEALGVSNLLEGSVRRFGNKVRVNVQLIGAIRDEHIWAQDYESDLTDVLKIQTDLVHQIASVLQAKLSPIEKEQIEWKPTENAEAYLAFIQAHNVQTADEELERLERGEQLYERAIQLDPNFALAFARYSQLESWILHSFEPTLARRDKARALAERALQLQPGLPEAHLALGFSLYYGDRDYERALAEFETARKGLPNAPEIFLAIAAIERRQGKWAESKANFEKGVSLNPKYPISLENLP